MSCQFKTLPPDSLLSLCVRESVRGFGTVFRRNSYGLHDLSLMVAHFYLQNELHIASRSLRLRGPRPFLDSRRVLPCSRRHRLLHCHAQQVQDKMTTTNVDMKVGLSEANTIDVYTSKKDSAKSAGSANQRRSGSVLHRCRSVWTF